MQEKMETLNYSVLIIAIESKIEDLRMGKKFYNLIDELTINLCRELSLIMQY